MGCICSKENVDIQGKRFYIKSHLGEGGFSTVDIVEDDSGRLFALKRITCHSPEDERNAQTEISYHKALCHPNVIECLGSSIKGKADLTNNTTSTVCLLLPYYKQGTLQALLESRSKTRDFLTEEQVLIYFQQICEGVKVIHDIGAAHRDLKTANVLLSGNKVVVMDLGSMSLAKVEIKNYSDAQKLQDVAAEKSSMTYRAPELFHVEHPAVIDERTDIWSLGCMLYALCFFKSPYDEVYERGDSVALAVGSGNVHIPSFSPFSDSMHELIQKLLVVEPASRPYVAEVLADIEALRRTKQLSRSPIHINT